MCFMVWASYYEATFKPPNTSCYSQVENIRRHHGGKEIWKGESPPSFPYFFIIKKRSRRWAHILPRITPADARHSGGWCPLCGWRNNIYCVLAIQPAATLSGDPHRQFNMKESIMGLLVNVVKSSKISRCELSFVSDNLILRRRRMKPRGTKGTE